MKYYERGQTANSFILFKALQVLLLLTVKDTDIVTNRIILTPIQPSSDPYVSSYSFGISDLLWSFVNQRIRSLTLFHPPESE